MAEATETDRLEQLVDDFAAQMKAKLLKKQGEGYSGWEDRSKRGSIMFSMLDHTRRAGSGDAAQYVDIANLAAILWNLDGRKR